MSRRFRLALPSKGRLHEPALDLVRAAGFQVDDLFFPASPYPFLGALDRAFPMVGLCRFRTCLRAIPSSS